MPEQILRLNEVLAAVKLGRTTIYNLEKVGQFPARRRIGPNSVGWLESEVVEWMRTRAAEPGMKPAIALEAKAARAAAREAADSSPAIA